MTTCSPAPPPSTACRSPSPRPSPTWPPASSWSMRQTSCTRCGTASPRGPTAGPPTSWRTPAIAAPPCASSGPTAHSAANGRAGRSATIPDAVVRRYTCGVRAIYLARRPASATCAAAGRRRHSRPAEVHARYISGQSPGGDISRGTEAQTTLRSTRRAFASPTGSQGGQRGGAPGRLPRRCQRGAVLAPLARSGR